MGVGHRSASRFEVPNHTTPAGFNCIAVHVEASLDPSINKIDPCARGIGRRLLGDDERVIVCLIAEYRLAHRALPDIHDTNQ